MITNILLFAFLVVWIADLWWNRIVLRRHAMTSMENMAIHKAESERLRAELKAAYNAIERLPDISRSAFAISVEGVKALPNDWIERCWPDGEKS